jgi:hypothetical protein
VAPDYARRTGRSIPNPVGVGRLLRRQSTRQIIDD